MSQYTTELRYIINDNIDIFDFEFTFINDELKNKLKKDFINHFYFHEIGFETIAKFKHYLKIEFTETLPFYEEQMKINLMEYDIINNYDLKEEYTTHTSHISIVVLDHIALALLVKVNAFKLALP